MSTAVTVLIWMIVALLAITAIASAVFAIVGIPRIRKMWKKHEAMEREIDERIKVGARWRRP